MFGLGDFYDLEIDACADFTVWGRARFWMRAFFPEMSNVMHLLWSTINRGTGTFSIDEILLEQDSPDSY